MAATVGEEGEELDGLCEFLDDEPLVATMPVPARWWDPPEPLPETRAKAAAQPQAPTQQVECCICLTATDIGNMATYLPCGHCAVCVCCFGKQSSLDVAEDRHTTCPKCRAIVTSWVQVFV